MSEEYHFAWRNQVCQLKWLIICEVGLKLFPLLGESIKWHSAAELHEIPLVNKSSSQPAELESERKKERVRGGERGEDGDGLKEAMGKCRRNMRCPE